jgi:Na+-transporting methylmalonyl-CoA/oxaloacetate decarboxylase gamma subunit
MIPGDKVFVVDGTRLRMSRFVRRYTSGRMSVQYHFDSEIPTWTVDQENVFASEDDARSRLADVIASKVAEHERAIARLRAVDSATAPVLVRTLTRAPRTLVAVMGGAK